MDLNIFNTEDLVYFVLALSFVTGVLTAVGFLGYWAIKKLIEKVCNNA